MTAAKQTPIVLGITGGVASGKSTVATFFADRGAYLVSADEIARDLLAPGSKTTKAVLTLFGREFALDMDSEQVDRRKLARRVFSNEAARIALGKIMHPEIRRVILTEIEAGKKDEACLMVAVEIPLLFENHLEEMVDKILVASCPEAVQVERLRARQPWLNQEDALRQIRTQIPLSEKLRKANCVIDTNRPIDLVRADADAVWYGLVGNQRTGKIASFSRDT